ncbi:MAG TPA: NUDIX domain-containing protein [Thermomicrobiales bacterium]|nr:NUDIX domain-containing protein [Thermomicrobiales bacterium]
MTRHNRFTTPVAVHLFLLRGDRILLLRRFNTGYEDGKYSVIAGHLDGGETVLSAMCREAQEEAGIRLDLKSTRVVGVMHRLSNDERIDFFLTAERWDGKVRNCEPEKCDELRWVPIDQLPENTIPYVASAIDTWRRGVWFSEFGWD